LSQRLHFHVPKTKQSSGPTDEYLGFKHNLRGNIDDHIILLVMIVLLVLLSHKVNSNNG
jgi:hypothetical protein